MSRLKIVDLSFCETEFSSNSQVIGGITVYSPTGSWSASYGSAKSAGYYTDHFFDKTTGNYGYLVIAHTDGAVGGAIAGALGDGTNYASSYSIAGI
ncbi:MAG: hypothetical protein VKL59_23175 [Nostocaceae cyanobacterium]|nr:hypothetical protein [Nostocaceae cyanobacterium]